MALALSYPSPFGGEQFTYFIIGEVNENRYHSTAMIILYGFIDEAARQAMARPIPLTIAIESDQWIRDASIAEIYSLVKTVSPFLDAADA